MADYKKRVEDEFRELQMKIHKLDQFIIGNAFQKLDGRNKALLKIQLDSMRTYATCLRERIKIM